MKYLKRALLLLDKKQKNKFTILIFLFLILSFLEVLGIGMILPLLTVLFQPENIPDFKFIEIFKPFLETNRDVLVPIFLISFFLIFLIKNIYNILVYRLVHNFNQHLYADLSTKVLRKYFHQNFIFFSENKQSVLVTVMANEVNIFCTIFMDALLILLSELIIFISLILLILFSGRQESFIILIPLIVIVALFVKFTNKKIKKKSLERVSLSEKSQTLAQRIFLGIRDIFFSNRADFYTESYHGYLKSQAKINSFVQTIQLVPRALLELFALGTLLSIIAILHYDNRDSNNIISTLAFYFIILYRLMPSYNKILVQFQRMKYAMNSSTNIYSKLNLEDKRALLPPKNKTLLFSNSIELKNCNFSFSNGKEIFKNLNFKLNRGDRIGIYGSSGSGKSTFLNLITMLFTPQTGDLFIDQKLVKDKDDIRLFQNHITYISQDTYLFEDSIKNNIVLDSNKKIDQDRLDYAIDFSQLNPVLSQFENKIEYKIGSHSRTISSGQRQRIALARAIYNLTDILILDEATNALDEKNENNIFENIYKLNKNYTIIIVSHHLENLSKCDKVYEVCDGKLTKK